MEQNDESLLDLYFSGDAKAFEEFFSRHSGRVMAYGKKMGLSHQDALDLTQEVFLRLHRVIHKYERGRPALPWFFTIVHRMAIDTLRQVKSNHARFVSDDRKVNNTQADGEVVCELPEVSNDAMAKLSSDQKAIIELRLTKDLSFKDIGLAIGKTEATSRKIFERSIKILKAHIASQDKRNE